MEREGNRNMKARFRIKNEKNHPKGFIVMPLNVAAFKMFRDDDAAKAFGSCIYDRATYYRPSNHFYQTQYEYHGTFK